MPASGESALSQGAALVRKQIPNQKFHAIQMHTSTRTHTAVGIDAILGLRAYETEM